MVNTKQERCAGCGNQLEVGDDVVRIAHGIRGKGVPFRERGQWGVLHRSCFNRSIDSPAAVRDEILRASEAVVHGKAKAG